MTLCLLLFQELSLALKGSSRGIISSGLSLSLSLKVFHPLFALIPSLILQGHGVLDLLEPVGRLHTQVSGNADWNLTILIIRLQLYNANDKEN